MTLFMASVFDTHTSVISQSPGRVLPDSSYDPHMKWHSICSSPTSLVSHASNLLWCTYNTSYNRRFLRLLSMAVISNHDRKQLGKEERVHFILPFTVHSGGKSGQELGQRSGRSAEERLDSLGSLSWLLVLYTLRHLPKDGTTHSRLGFPPPIINQENAAQACLQASHREAVSQVRFPLSRLPQLQSS